MRLPLTLGVTVGPASALGGCRHPDRYRADRAGAGAEQHCTGREETRFLDERCCMIPITVVDVRDAEALVLEVVRSGVIAQGLMVKRFEEAFAEVAGVRHAVAV